MILKKVKQAMKTCFDQLYLRFNLANFGHFLAQFPSCKHSNLTMGLDMCYSSVTRFQSATSGLLAVGLAIRHTELLMMTTQRNGQPISMLGKSATENRSTQKCYSPDFLPVGYF